jgi:hypothetical protein
VLQGMELKGQMVYCPESDSLLFVASPFLDGLEGLTGRGLYISDIPIHDATRDVILVGEQSRAQVCKPNIPFFVRTCEQTNVAHSDESWLATMGLIQNLNIGFALDVVRVHRLIYINQRDSQLCMFAVCTSEQMLTGHSYESLVVKCTGVI